MFAITATKQTIFFNAALFRVHQVRIYASTPILSFAIFLLQKGASRAVCPLQQTHFFTVLTSENKSFKGDKHSWWGECLLLARNMCIQNILRLAELESDTKIHISLKEMKTMS